MYYKKSFAVCLLVMVVCIVKDCSSFCKPFNKSTGIAELCGYPSTSNFTHDKHYISALNGLRSVSKILSSCSEYANVIACSVYTPRCEENIPGPFLPCRRVCDEVNRQCRDRIPQFTLEWIIGMCQLLPEKDDPNTKLGYLGRCFEPPNFKTNLTRSIPLKCNKLVVPICQHLGYTHTVVSVARQKAHASWACRKINNAIDTTTCSLPQKRFFCMENFPPCINNTIGFYCRSKCNDFFQMNCTKTLNYERDICMEMPEGSSENDVCEQTHWPRALNWPQVRDAAQKTNKKTTPTVDSSVTMTTAAPEATGEQNTTTKPGDSNDPSAIKATPKSHKAKVAPIVGGLMAGICVIALGLLIAYLIYKSKKRAAAFPRDKQILYNEDNVEI